MIFKYSYFFLVIIANFNYGMECDNKSSANKNQAVFELRLKNKELTFKDLTLEIIVRVAKQLLSANNREKVAEKILNYKRFALAVLQMTRVNLMSKILTKEQYILFFAKKLRVNPFFIATFLKIRLSSDLKNKFNESALENEINKRKLNKEQLESKVNSQGILRSHLEQIFFNALPKHESQFIILLLYLLGTGTSPNFISYYGPNKNSALIYCASVGCEELVEVLLNVGANPNYKNTLGETAIYRASLHSKNKRIVKMLLAAGADVNVRCNDGGTPLMNKAALYCSKEIVKTLLEAGIDPNCKNKMGNTALILVSTNRNMDTECVIELLLKAGAKINIQNNQGDTALIKAADYNCLKIVGLLLLNRADPNIQNKEGSTALYCAKRNNNDQILKLLKSYGAKSSKCVSS